MPSGKKSKELRRAAAAAPPPRVRSKGAPRSREASPRVLVAVGGVIVLAVVGVVLGVVLTRGGSSLPKDIPTVGSLQNALPGAADVQAMYKGIPQKGLLLGSSSAPAQMVIYIDLQCPICRNYETTVMPTVVSKYVKTGKLRVEVKPWAFLGPDSVRGQAAMFAAAKQNKAFNFASVLYDNQGIENTGWLDDTMIAKIAASVPGMNVTQLLSDRKAGFVEGEQKAVDQAANEQHVSGTPTVFVGTTGARPALVGSADAVPDLQQTEDAITTAVAS
jgi:protein-disulfide isomerase